MICNSRPGGWELVYQRAHAFLSMQLLADWREQWRLEPWLSILNATAQHDFGWEEWSGENALEEDGRPRPFFNTPCAQAEGLARRAVRGAAQQDRYCALLVARHIQYLYGEAHPGLAPLLAQLQEQSQRWRTELGIEEEQVDQAYAFVLWADTASLLLCVEDSAFRRHLSLRLGDTPYRLQPLQAGEWSLDPWPYRSGERRLHWDTYPVEQERFGNAGEFLAVLETAPVRVRQVRLVPHG